MQLLVKGIIFNSLAFIISYGIYRIALINLPPLVALTLTGILYGIIGVLIDPQIRGFVLGFIKQKLIRNMLKNKKFFLFKNGKAFCFYIPLFFFSKKFYIFQVKLTYFLKMPYTKLHVNYEFQCL